MPAIRNESVERALSILLAFSKRRPKLSLADLAEETGLHKSTILRLTRSLGLYGFLDRHEAGRMVSSLSKTCLKISPRCQTPSPSDKRPPPLRSRKPHIPT